MSKTCRLFGISRQAIYHQEARCSDFAYLKREQMLVKPMKNYTRTTFSKHWLHKYPNLLKDIDIRRTEQVFVSDITYIRFVNGFLYLALITDAYSRKIIGYHLGQTLETIHSMIALRMAIKNINPQKQHNIIHHSDRGIQYCSQDYVALLQDNGILISMTGNGDPLENAIAERVNGIIKEEYLKKHQYGTIKEIEDKLNQVVRLYNNERPHMSCSMLTPDMVHKNSLVTKKHWKTYYRSKKSAVVISNSF